jgi:hypothetical protein
MARDKQGRLIEPGDVLSVLHYVARNRKRVYMIKQALRYEGGRLVISHLNRVNDEPWEVGKNYYTVGADERLADTEIIQSIDCKFNERPKVAA